MHRRVWEYSREQTHGEREREILRLKCARKNISLCEWCDGGVAKDVSHFSYLRYVLDRFSDATNETCGRVLDARERSRAFRRRKKFLPQEGSVCLSWERVRLSRILSFSRPFSLCLSHACVRALFAAEKNYDETPLCSSFYPSALTTPFPFLLTGYRSRSWRPQQKDEAHFAKVRKRLLGVVGETLPFPREKNGL